MKIRKRIFCVAVSALLCFSFLVGCRTGIPEGDETKAPFVNPYDVAEDACLAHRFEDGVCEQCGEDYKPSEGLAYEQVNIGDEENPEMVYYVSGIGECKDTQIIIPATYEGLPVLGISPRAFLTLKTLTYVRLPEGATSIGEWAFQGCSQLRRVEIPSTVNHIGREAFDGCLRLTEVLIPEGVSVIYESTFCDCVRLTTVTLPSTLKEIKDHAFEGCRSLTEITIPSRVKLIEGGAFRNCDGLTAVQYEGSLKNWCEIEFGLIDANPVELAGHLYVQGKPVEGVLTVPEGVINITRNALCGLVDVTAVIFPESVETTGSFEGCTQLEYIIFQGAPTYPGDNYSFRNTGVKHVYLSDTKEEAGLYIAYLAAACKEHDVAFHYADAWTYDQNGVPQLLENSVS